MQVLLEQPLQLAPRHGHIHRQFVQVDRLFEVGFHQRDDFLQLRLVGAKHVLERHALVILLVADALVDEHLGNRGRQFATMIAADQVQHHVQRRGATGAGETVTVEGEQTGAHVDPWIGLLHRRQTFPVHAAIEAIEQAGAGQCPTAGAHRAKATRLAGLGLQPGDMFTGHGALDTHTPADDHGVDGWGAVHGGIRGDLQTIAGPDLAAVDGECVPAIQLTTGQLVGHAQRLDGRCQGNQGEVVQ
ncbi:hypothetical protein D3C79_760440 [compost metagenome]